MENAFLYIHIIYTQFVVSSESALLLETRISPLLLCMVIPCMSLPLLIYLCPMAHAR
ncbi:hypothetical protein F5B22DRAFT_629930 [Xylaria bambusicola]|uniref:uncharacterized protein n=1 Tax=Xylaria bambusicola TaxID=326684 RepID=UPI002008BDD8|nr:uncharacterized protein F5B22DRAFT_629930 [Xylaria bambusicola]KAI0503312.1 hypothetical protein F5B22DRAFT_629930 [Xylaria bambusicola]